MAKVLLVEDDNNLREIYEARLQAEGYEIVSASDGEQALVVAKNEKPDLVISDVMMPKISGFEMLDILRNTDGLKDVQVIMLTALGQSEDKARADSLGANKYLVKSQVTLEDIVKTAHQLLNDAPEPEPAAPVAAATPAQVAPAPEPVAAVPAPAPVSAPVEPAVVAPAAPVIPEPVTPAPVAPAAVSTSAVEPPAAPVVPEPAAPIAPVVTAPAAVEVPAAVPIPDEAPAASAANDQSESEAAETANMQAQIANFESAPAQDPPAVEPVPDAASTEMEAPEPAPEPAVVPTAEPSAAPAPAPEVISPDASNSNVMAEAVESLNAATQPAGKPSEVTAVEVAPAATTTPDPIPTPPVAVEAAAGADDNVTIAHKKIIQPITGEGPAKKDLNDLLADEEAKNVVTAAAAPAPEPAAIVMPPSSEPIEPSAPQTTVVPTPEPAATSAPVTPPPTGPDPNSIAL